MSRGTNVGNERQQPPTEGSLDPRQFREGHGVTLDQIAERTKISTRFLLAIESADYEKLPGGVFAINYLRQYAAVAGCNEVALLRDYRRRMRVETESAPQPLSPWRRWLGIA